jgi:RNA polymerase sigma factor (sigma-70 family)
MDAAALAPAAQREDLRDTFDQRFFGARPTLLAVCRAVVGPDEAEDVVQETYLRAKERLDQLRDPGLFEAWLARIALNEARSLARRRRHAPLHLGEPELAGAMNAARDAALLELVDGLPTRERMCVVLHYGHGYPLGDVARLLGVSTINARTILFRARRHLRRALTEAGQ